MLHQEGYHTYYIYILTNKYKTVFYRGVTNNLKIRLNQHKENSITGIEPLHQNTMQRTCYIMKNSHGFKKQLLEKKK
jgi:hypothetical protein